MQPPLHQRVSQIMLYVLGGFLALGAVLDSVANAVSLLTPWVASLGTACIVLGWLGLQILLPAHPVPWVMGNQRVLVRQLGVWPTAFAVGMVLLLWMPSVIMRWHPIPPPASDKGTPGGMTAGRDVDVVVNVSGGIIQTGPGSVVNQTLGIPPEEYARKAGELDVTQAALASFFNILEQQRVPREDLDSKLREIAASYKQLQAQLQQFLSEDAAVLALRREASQALEAGDFAQVETVLRQAQAHDLHAIQTQQAALKQRQLSTATTSAELGALKNLQLAYADAARHYRQAAAVVPQNEATTQAAYLNAEGLAWMAAGQYAEAQPALEHALALREQMLDPEHPDVATSLNNLAQVYESQNCYTEAEPLYRRALTIVEKALGPQHLHVALSLNNVARLYRRQRRYRDAESYYQRALDILEKGVGREEPYVATTLNNLAYLYSLQQRYREAESLHQRALAIREHTLPPAHPEIASSLNNLALLYQVQQRYSEAEPFYKRALDIWEKTLGPDHQDVARCLQNYAGLLRAISRTREAEVLEARANAIVGRAQQSEPRYHEGSGTCPRPNNF